MSDRLDDIKYWSVINEQTIHPKVSLYKSDFDWLIEQAEKVVELERENKSLAMKIISEEEFEILQHWGFIASTERPLSKKEAELYFKITDV